ncbi:MAG: sulfotransferase domain-containing protein [Planctomycetes bacterium]|nr:sulfotransferase domain-containing protein [Planctomycetota bacterium]
MKKLLVTGYMRSGTTLLANFLNYQKECLVYRDFLRPIFITSRHLGITSFLSTLTDQQKNVLLSELKAESGILGSKMMDGLEKDFSNLKELYDRALYAVKGNNDIEIVGSKVTMVGDWLLKTVEETDVYVIYIYRDARDVLLSAKNRFAKYNLMKVMIDLQRDLEVALNIKSERLILIKYEDLVLDTDSVAKQLSDFLGVNIVKDISTAKDREMDWVDNSAFHDLDRVFDPKACYRWKKDQKSKEVKSCEILMAGFIDRLGYNCMGMEAFSVWDKLCAYRDYYVQKFKNAAK